MTKEGINTSLQVLVYITQHLAIQYKALCVFYFKMGYIALLGCFDCIIRLWLLVQEEGKTQRTKNKKNSYLLDILFEPFMFVETGCVRLDREKELDA